MSLSVIYHITTLSAWEDAQDKGYYEPTSYKDEGFIVCCTTEQLDGFLANKFSEHENLVKLVIEPIRLTEHLKYEKLPGSNEEFPLIYGLLNLQAVSEVVFLDPITEEQDKKI